MWPGHSASAELVHLANSTFWNSFKPRPAQYTFNYITIHMYIYIYIYNDIYIYIHNDTHIYIDTYALQIMSIYIQRIQCIYIYIYTYLPVFLTAGSQFIPSSEQKTPFTRLRYTPLPVSFVTPNVQDYLTSTELRNIGPDRR